VGPKAKRDWAIVREEAGMRWVIWTVLGLATSAAWAADPEQAAPDKAQAIIDRAVQAHGGLARLAKLQTMKILLKGQVNLPDRGEGPCNLEITWKMPYRYRSTLEAELGGQKLSQSIGISGGVGWISVNGETQAFTDKDLAEARELIYMENIDKLVILKEPRRFEFSLAGEGKVGDQPVVAVKVTSKGHRPVVLSFSTETGLLAKREYRQQVDKNKEVLHEVTYTDYITKDGIKHWTRVATYRDGKKVIDAELDELRFLDKVNDAVFLRP
jgi:hypothetical protein